MEIDIFLPMMEQKYLQKEILIPGSTRIHILSH